MPKRIFRVTNLVTGEVFYYSSKTAAIADKRNGLVISLEHFTRRGKKEGYPFTTNDSRVEVVEVLTAPEARNLVP